MKTKIEKFTLSLLILATLLVVKYDANATSKDTTCTYQQVGQSVFPPVLATNSSLNFIGAPTVNTVTNADGTIYTNTIAPFTIDTSKARFVSLEIWLASSSLGVTAAGASNAIYTFAPCLVNTTNGWLMTPPSGQTLTNALSSTNGLGGLTVDTNHLYTITVPLPQVAGQTMRFLTNIDCAGLQGLWLVGTSNQCKNALITNTIFYSAKNFAP